MFANRLRKRGRHLRKWARREAVTCYRIYDRDIPEIPLAVDRYLVGEDVHFVVGSFEREDEHDAGWFDAMCGAVAEVFDAPAERVHGRRRQRQRGTQQYEVLAPGGQRFEVAEGGHRFWVDFARYLDTGLFLDHRHTRRQVQLEAQNARFLNLFCYTGAFTVYAAAGGARSSQSVDLSNTYLDWAADNLALNGADRDRHQLVRADVLAWIRSARLAGDFEPFDLAVLDPPTFSNSKSMDGSFDVQRDHGELVANTLALLRPGATLYFSCNRRKFRLDEGAFAASSVEDITDKSVPEDFGSRRPHRAYRIVR